MMFNRKLKVRINQLERQIEVYRKTVELQKSNNSKLLAQVKLLTGQPSKEEVELGTAILDVLDNSLSMSAHAEVFARFEYGYDR